MLRRIALTVVGLTLAVALGVVLYQSLEEPSACDICYRPMHEETYYRIHLDGGESLDVCCPRCGLRFQEGRDDVVRVEVTDFLTKERVPAEIAFYVENSPVHFCSHSLVQEDRSGTRYQVAWDRCLPSLIAFESRASARDFQEENGGVVKTYEELLEEEVP